MPFSVFYEFKNFLLLLTKHWYFVAVWRVDSHSLFAPLFFSFSPYILSLSYYIACYHFGFDTISCLPYNEYWCNAWLIVALFFALCVFREFTMSDVKLCKLCPLHVQILAHYTRKFMINTLCGFVEMAFVVLEPGKY